MRMPVMDGYEATRRIREIEKLQPATPIIALTASALEEERSLVLAAGCDDFLRKPFRESEIFDLMTKHIGVQFIYENILDTKNKPSGDRLPSPAGLRALPEAWVAELLIAVRKTDPEESEIVVRQIREKDESLADALDELVCEFRFDILQDILMNIKETDLERKES